MTTRAFFMHLYLNHLKTLPTRREAYERAEADNVAMDGKRKYKSYYVFCNARVNAFNAGMDGIKAEPGVKTRSTLSEFIAVYQDFMPKAPSYSQAYDWAEKWHLGEYGTRRFKDIGSFRPQYGRSVG